jgi:uncharacterized membrane protein
MSWIIYALGAISTAAVSDIFRKLGSNLKDPFFANLIFQFGASTAGLVLFLLFSRKFAGDSKTMIYAFIGGILISIFTAFSFKALSIGPGVSTVMPAMRIGGVALVAILGILVLKEKLTWNIVVGIILAGTGVYLLFLNK